MKLAQTRLFNDVQDLRPGRSAFDLSYNKLLTGDMGYLYPVLCEEMVPGDIFKIGNEIVIRTQPMLAPILHEINVFVHYFFVPYRILWQKGQDPHYPVGWETFISGGPTGSDTSAPPDTHEEIASPERFWDRSSGSLWDYFGFPLFASGHSPAGAHPLQFPWLAYNRIWNEFYRDETLQTPVDEHQGAPLKRNWHKDYFTSALPWQQRSTNPPALPVSGYAPVTFDPAVFASPPAGATNVLVSGNASTEEIGATTASDTLNLQNALNSATADMSAGTSVDIADLRLAIQLQRWQERNARTGVRYTEFLKAHFSVSPSDQRLQRPEWIGGTKAPVIVSEVLQTSEDGTTPQGTMKGHGIGVAQNFIGSYRAEEYGVIMGLLSIMPKAMYTQGIDRQWLRRSKYDFFFPEFANLSEQAIEQCELYAEDSSSENTKLFGYQGRYDEMRVKKNMVTHQFRDTFDYWHLARFFNSAPELNSSFITCSPEKRIFPVQAQTDSCFFINFANRIKAIRPLPAIAQPGLMDHV